MIPYRIWHEPWFDIDTDNPPDKEKLLPPVTFGGQGLGEKVGGEASIN